MQLKNLSKLLLILTILSVSGSCSLLHPGSQKKIEKKQEQASKKAMQEYEKAKESHIRKQNKETKQMMKRTKKKANRLNAYKKRRTFLWW